MGILKKHKLLGTKGQYDQSVCGTLFPKDVPGFWANERAPLQNVCSRCRGQHVRGKRPDIMSRFGHLIGEGKQGGQMDEVILAFVEKHGRWPAAEDIQVDLPNLTPKRIQGHLNHIQRDHHDLLNEFL